MKSPSVSHAVSDFFCEKSEREVSKYPAQEEFRLQYRRLTKLESTTLTILLIKIQGFSLEILSDRGNILQLETLRAENELREVIR